MTIREAIETVDRLTPNQYENIDKVRWLSELDGVVYKEIICTHLTQEPQAKEPWVRVDDPFDRAAATAPEETQPEAFTGYAEPVDFDTVLLVPWPYDEIYRWYLDLKIAEANGEDARSNNALSRYSSYYSAFQAAYNRSHTPAQYAPHFHL